MGRYRTEGTMEAFWNVHKTGGVLAFWNGTSAKMVESASKGAILLFAKETLLHSLETAGVNPTVAGLLFYASAAVDHFPDKRVFP